MTDRPYRDWQITLRLDSPLGSPMQSDTLFGHLCWQVVLEEGEGGLRRFLEPFLQGRPPFVLSDAFPAGLLPKPLLPRRTIQARHPDDYQRQRRRAKAPFVSIDHFCALRTGHPIDWQPLDDPWQRVQIPHAAIDRRLDTTGPRETAAGRFYHTPATVLPQDSRLHLYLRELDDCHQRVFELLERLGLTGFGRDKSVGCGQFKLQQCRCWDRFSPFPEADAFVCLSTFMPAAGDPTQGRWLWRVKHGRLCEHAGSGNPFKRPLIQFLPGAVFQTHGPPPRPFYGRIVGDISPAFPQAVQCGLTLAVPCCWREI